MSSVTFGRYQVIEELGAGGFATVYRGYDPVLDRAVAIKVLHPHLARDTQTRERFVREGRALARVHHPNVVQVFDAGEIDRTAYLAMEFVPGRSLAEIGHGRPMPLADVLAVVRQIAPALDAVHDAGLLHRDVKPANILVAEAAGGGRIGRAVLLDLGIARELDRTGLTATGSVLGTPGFLAPEQVEGGGRMDPRTDVYQLAATVYALLAGRPPFEGDTAQVLYAVAHRAPPDLSGARPDLPPHVIATVAEGLAKDPSRRPARAAVLAAMLEGSAPVADQASTVAAVMSPPPAAPAGIEQRTTRSSQPSGAPPATTPPPARGRGGRRLLFAGAGALAALAIGGAAFALTRGGNAGPPAPTRQAGERGSVTVTRTPAPTATVTAAGSATPATTSTPVPSLTAAPARLSLPTEPARQIPIPAGVSTQEREVLRLLNRNGSAYASAVHDVDYAPLRDVFTGAAYEQYARVVADLSSAGRYEVAELLTISLTELNVEGPDSASARTVEDWSNATYDRASGRRLDGTETVYDEFYRFIRIGGRWLIRENTYTTVRRTTN